MVFGNLGRTSATGVCFSRNPSTGAKAMYGGYTIGAQGEDMVAGGCQVIPIAQMQDDFFAAYEALVSNCEQLELAHRDMQVTYLAPAHPMAVGHMLSSVRMHVHCAVQSLQGQQRSAACVSAMMGGRARSAAARQCRRWSSLYKRAGCGCCSAVEASGRVWQRWQ